MKKHSGLLKKVGPRVGKHSGLEKRNVGPRMGKHSGLELGANRTPGAALDAEAEGSSLAKSHAEEPRSSL